jgi:hypothetical protein
MDAPKRDTGLPPSPGSEAERRFIDGGPRIRTRGGYFCELCPKDTRQIYPSRDALRTADIFEPFLDWINDDLAKAEAIVLDGEPGRWTSARLDPRS